MKVHDGGRALDAEFSVDEEEGTLTLTIESRGGSRGAPNERNRDYNAGLTLLIARLSELGAEIRDAQVVSSVALANYPSAEDRRLAIASGYPVRLVGRDPGEIRLEFGRAQRTAARDPSLRPGGNNNKRVRFWLRDVDLGPADLATYLAYADSSEGAIHASTDDMSVNESQEPASAIEGGGAPLTNSGQLERLVLAKIRIEQRELRSRCLGRVEHASCDLCGDDLPVRHLRMAHIKKRSKCTDQEKLDLNNVMTACVTCDAMFEVGDLIVVDDGTVRAGPVEPKGEDLAEAVALRVGRRCRAFGEASAHYFAFHRAQFAATSPD